MEQDIISGSLQVDYNGQIYLKETAKWAKFLAVLGFIGSIIMILIGIGIMVGGALMPSSSMNDFDVLSIFGASAVGFVYLLSGVIMLFVSIQMLRYANKTKTSLANNDPLLLNSGFGNLRMVFRIYGILTIVYLALIILALVLVIFLGFRNFI